MSGSLFRLICAATTVLALCLPKPAQADPHPRGFTNHRFNDGRNPFTKGGVTTFAISDKQCSKVDYGDGRGENDCHNGNVRQNLVFNKEARLGQTISYNFDIWVAPGFKYPGFSNSHAQGFLKNSLDSRLRIASWEGEFLHNFIYMLKVDSINGISFLGNVCQPRADFGKWVSFEMKVRWSRDAKGWIDVSCGGKVIHSAKNLPTNQNPHCYITNQCEPEKKKNPKRISFLLGPVMAGFGPEWEKYGKGSQFTDIQPDGITIRMRSVSVIGKK